MSVVAEVLGSEPGDLDMIDELKEIDFVEEAAGYGAPSIKSVALWTETQGRQVFVYADHDGLGEECWRHMGSADMKEVLSEAALRGYRRRKEINDE